MEALRKKERQGETQFPTKIDDSHPLYMTKLRVPGSGAVLRFYGPVAIYSSYLFQNIANR